MRNIWLGFQAWRHADDPLVASANTVALVVGWNTPFYPLYVWWAAGSSGMPYALATLCSLPFFFAVPEVSRRAPKAGRAMLPIVGSANSVFCTWLLGAGSGAELFHLPCILLGGLLFRRTERLWQLGVIGLPMAAVFGFHGRYGAPPHEYTAAQYQALFSMNLFSVVTLFSFLALLFAPSGLAPSGTNHHSDKRGGDQYP